MMPMDKEMMGPGADEPMEDEQDSESLDEYGGEFASAIQEAFPDQEWSGDRLAAMKEAIRLCVEKDEGMSKSPGKGSLALIFGGKPKKE